MGQNPETKKKYMQVIPTRKKITSLSPRVEGESLPHLEWKHTEEWCVWRKERRLRKQKDKGAGSWGQREILWPTEGKAMFLFSQTKGGRIPQNSMTVKLYTRGVENSDFICSSWQPLCLGLSLDCQQASACQDTHTGKKCGQLTRIMGSCKHDHRMERCNILEHTWFWIELFPPF